MTRQHGGFVKAYLGSRDVSGDISAIEPELTCDTEDSTNLNSAGWKEADPTLLGWTCPFTAFYDPVAGGIAEQVRTPGTTFPALSIVDGSADAIGDPARVFGAGLLTTKGAPINVAELVKIAGELTGQGKGGALGVLLHVLGQEAATVSAASVNNVAATAAGGRFNLHVTAVTGSWTVKIESSGDNGAGDAWVAIATFAQATTAGGPTSQSIEVSGAVEQYLRVTATEDVPGSCTFAVIGARY